MNQKKFKFTSKPPACTQQPWKFLIPDNIRDETLRAIKQETIEKYGFSMDECPKRKVCLTKDCIGRPLPWLSPTAKPYLDQLTKTHTIKQDELFLDNCDTCVIKTTCNSTCPQVNDFMNRHQDKEPNLIYQENLENHNVESSNNVGEFIFSGALKVPWDALTPAKQTLVKKYIYEQKDFLSISKDLNLTNQARAKYEFYAALTVLSEYAIMRKFLVENGRELTDKQLEVLNLVYLENKTLTDTALQLNITKQAIQQIITRVVKANHLKWHRFVKKHNNKVIYNIPQIIRS